MAFKRGDIRDILTKAGAADDKVEEAITSIVNLHLGVVDPLKTENESLESKVKTAEKLKTQLENANKELAELKEADYKGKYEAEKANGEKLKTEYENYKTEQENKAARAAKETAFKGVLKDAGIPERHWAKIIKYSDIDGIELDGDKPKNSKELLDNVKMEWEDHVEKVIEKGTNTPTPPTGTGGKAAITKDEIMAIKNTAERQAKIAEYPELFGITN